MISRRRRGQLRRSLCVPALCAVGACSPAPQSAPEVAVPRPAAVAPAPGDAVRILVWREPDLSGEFIVDARGVVTLPLVGEHDIGGMDPEWIRQSLLKDYREFLRNPSIEVTLLRRINVLGEVRSPGLYRVDLTVSLADMVAMAGGLSPTGNPNRVSLVRDGEVIQQSIDQSALVGSIGVSSGDQIVVGQKSWLARNSGVVLGSAIAAAAIIAAAMINN